MIARLVLVDELFQLLQPRFLDFRVVGLRLGDRLAPGGLHAAELDVRANVVARLVVGQLFLERLKPFDAVRIAAVLHGEADHVGQLLDPLLLLDRLLGGRGELFQQVSPLLV